MIELFGWLLGCVGVVTFLYVAAIWADTLTNAMLNKKNKDD